MISLRDNEKFNCNPNAGTPFPKNECITIYTDSLLSGTVDFEEIGEGLAKVLTEVMSPYFDGTLFICGLGNCDVPADSIGPEVTRSIPLRFFDLSKTIRSNFQKVYSFTPGISWTSNLSVDTIVTTIVNATDADCVVLVDSIATNAYANLYRSIQISTTGRDCVHLGGYKINWGKLNSPIISIGVPTAIPANIIAPAYGSEGELFTSTKVNEAVSVAGAIIAYAFVRVCWPELSKKDCFSLIRLEKDPISLCPAFED